MTNIYNVSFDVFMLREIFNLCLIISLIVFATFLFLKMRQKEPKSAQRNIYLGYCLFLLSYACTRLFFIFSDIEIYNAKVPVTLLNTIYVGIAYAFGIFGALWLILMLERYLLHTKFVFTIFTVIILILSVISIFSLALNQLLQFIIAIALPAFFVIVVFLYLYVAIKASGEARNRSLGIIFGLVIMMIGFLFGSSLVGAYLDPAGLYTLRILVEPFIVIAGSAVFTFSQR